MATELITETEGFKFFVKQLELSEEDKDVYVEGYASAEIKDLDQEIITREALEKAAEDLRDPNYQYKGVFLGHKTDYPIPAGKVVDAKVVQVKGIYKLWVKILLNKAHPEFERIVYSIKKRFLVGLSIGFQIVEVKGNKILEIKILEVSFVGIPANPEATIEEVYVKGYSPTHPWHYSVSEKPWKKPRLKDFTDKTFEELSEREILDIAGHYAWSANNPPKSFADLRLGHHEPGSHALNRRGTYAAMAALGGARGGVNLPSERDFKIAYRHIADHYIKDLDRIPPEYEEIKQMREIIKDFKLYLYLRKKYAITQPYPKLEQIRDFVEKYFDPDTFDPEIEQFLQEQSGKEDRIEQSQIRALKSQANSDRNMSEVVEKNEAVEKTIEELTAKVKELSQTIAEKDKEIEKLKNTLKEAEDKLAEIKQAKEALEATIKEKEEKIAKLENEQKEALIEKLKRLDDKVKDDELREKTLDEIKAKYFAILEAKAFQKPVLPQKVEVEVPESEKDAVKEVFNKFVGGE